MYILVVYFLKETLKRVPRIYFNLSNYYCNYLFRTKYIFLDMHISTGYRYISCTLIYINLHFEYFRKQYTYCNAIS